MSLITWRDFLQFWKNSWLSCVCIARKITDPFAWSREKKLACFVVVILLFLKQYSVIRLGNSSVLPNIGWLGRRRRQAGIWNGTEDISAWMFSSSFLMKQFLTRIYCDGCSCVPHRGSSGIRYCRNVFLRRVLPCFVLFLFLITWTATNRLQGIYLHFWRVDAVMRGIYDGWR